MPVLDTSMIGFILEGALVTLKFTSLSILGGLTIGIILSFLRFSPYRIFIYFAKVYVSIFRGIPLILQLMLIYLGSPHLLGFPLTPFVAGVIVFSMNSGAYIAEILRSGIESIDKGQNEAALSLGIGYRDRMVHIIIPQAFKNILPALINEVVDLLKESALVSTIGEADLMRRAQLVASSQYIFFKPFIIAGLCYYTLVMALSFLAKVIERKMKGNSRHD